MRRVAALGFLLAVSGCHTSEETRLRKEVEQLVKENAELRTQVTLLIKQSQARDCEDDADDAVDAVDDAEVAYRPIHFDMDLARLFPRDPVTPRDAIQNSKDAYVHGQYDEAIRHARLAIPEEANQAYRLIGAAECFLKNQKGAMAASHKLDADGKQFVKYVCTRNGVKL